MNSLSHHTPQPLIAPHFPLKFPQKFSLHTSSLYYIFIQKSPKKFSPHNTSKNSLFHITFLNFSKKHCLRITASKTFVVTEVWRSRKFIMNSLFYLSHTPTTTCIIFSSQRNLLITHNTFKNFTCYEVFLVRIWSIL